MNKNILFTVFIYFVIVFILAGAVVTIWAGYNLHKANKGEIINVVKKKMDYNKKEKK